MCVAEGAARFLIASRESVKTCELRADAGPQDRSVRLIDGRGGALEDKSGRSAAGSIEQRHEISLAANDERASLRSAGRACDGLYRPARRTGQGSTFSGS